jgi:hypothetical protein
LEWSTKAAIVDLLVFRFSQNPLEIKSAISKIPLWKIMRNTERENPDIGKDVKIGREKKERIRMVALKGDTNRET